MTEDISMEGMFTDTGCWFNELKASCEWQSILNVRVIKPDGWDLSNFHKSWFEESISIREFLRRLEGSVYSRIIEGRFNIHSISSSCVTGKLCRVYEKGV